MSEFIQGIVIGGTGFGLIGFLLGRYVGIITMETTLRNPKHRALIRTWLAYYDRKQQRDEGR